MLFSLDIFPHLRGCFVNAATFCFCRVPIIKMRVLILMESRPEMLLWVDHTPEAFNLFDSDSKAAFPPQVLSATVVIMQIIITVITAEYPAAEKHTAFPSSPLMIVCHMFMVLFY